MKNCFQPKDNTFQHAESVVKKHVRLICTYFPNIDSTIREILTTEGLYTFFDALEQFDPSLDFRLENFIYKHIRYRLIFIANILLEHSKEFDEETFTTFHDAIPNPNLMTENKKLIHEIILPNHNTLTDKELFILTEYYFNSKTLAQIGKELLLSEYNVRSLLKLIIVKLQKALLSGHPTRPTFRDPVTVPFCTPMAKA